LAGEALDAPAPPRLSPGGRCSESGVGAGRGLATAQANILLNLH